MSFRYTLTVLKQEEECGYIQLFGNNDFIEQVHDFVEQRFQSELDEDSFFDDGLFKVRLNKDDLNGLYRVVDAYCLEFVLKDEKGHRYIDLLENYSKDADFGLSNWDVILGRYYALESAKLNDFLNKNEAFCGFMCPFEIKEGYEVLFRYS